PQGLRDQGLAGHRNDVGVFQGHRPVPLRTAGRRAQRLSATRNPHDARLSGRSDVLQDMRGALLGGRPQRLRPARRDGISRRQSGSDRDQPVSAGRLFAEPEGEDHSRAQGCLMNAVDEFEIKNPSKYLGNELAYLARVLEAKSWSNTGGSWTQAL